MGDETFGMEIGGVEVNIDANVVPGVVVVPSKDAPRVDELVAP